MREEQILTIRIVYREDCRENEELSKRVTGLQRS